MGRSRAVLVALMLVAMATPGHAQWKRGPLGIGFNLGLQHYVGDWNPGLGGAGDLVLRASLADFFNLALHAGYGKLTTNNAFPNFHTSLLNAELRATLLLLPGTRVSPLVYAGGGGFFYEVFDQDNRVMPRPDGGNYEGWDGLGFFGGGFDVMLAPTWSLTLTGDYHYTTSDGIDGNSAGTAPDGYFSGRAGLMYNIGGERDRDHDGVPDNRDGDKYQQEDFDGFQDMDGKPDPDNDGDGILDGDDKAPLVAEDRDGYQDSDGIPDPDNDNDGIVDAKDLSPNQPEDFDGWKDNDGAPDLDNDADGIPDAKDGAINLPEDIDGFKDDDGVPDYDNDADNVPDSIDVAQNLSETFNGFEDLDGAPDIRPLMLRDEKLILKGLGFKSGSASLLPDSYAFLEELVAFMKNTPEAQIELQGHTDNQGDEIRNMRLSVRRAEAVRAYLVSRGIADGRVVALGFGETTPIADNYYDDGRHANRRIEVLRTR